MAKRFEGKPAVVLAHPTIASASKRKMMIGKMQACIVDATVPEGDGPGPFFRFGIA